MREKLEIIDRAPGIPHVALSKFHFFVILEKILKHQIYLIIISFSHLVKGST